MFLSLVDVSWSMKTNDENERKMRWNCLNAPFYLPVAISDKLTLYDVEI